MKLVLILIIFTIINCSKGQLVKFSPKNKENTLEDKCIGKLRFKSEFLEYPSHSIISFKREELKPGKGDGFVLFSSYYGDSGISMSVSKIEIYSKKEKIFDQDYLENFFSINENESIYCNNQICGSSLNGVLSVDSITKKVKYYNSNSRIRLNSDEELSSKIHVDFKKSNCDTKKVYSEYYIKKRESFVIVDY